MVDKFKKRSFYLFNTEYQYVCYPIHCIAFHCKQTNRSYFLHLFTETHFIYSLSYTSIMQRENRQTLQQILVLILDSELSLASETEAKDPTLSTATFLITKIKFLFFLNFGHVFRIFYHCVTLEHLLVGLSQTQYKVVFILSDDTVEHRLPGE